MTAASFFSLPISESTLVWVISVSVRAERGKGARQVHEECAYLSTKTPAFRVGGSSTLITVLRGCEQQGKIGEKGGGVG